MLLEILVSALTVISQFKSAAPGNPVVAAPGLSLQIGQLSSILSTTSFTK